MLQYFYTTLGYFYNLLKIKFWVKYKIVRVNFNEVNILYWVGDVLIASSQKNMVFPVGRHGDTHL